ncbi:hypothetical protein [Microbacterium sp.]|uniref:hypothetical protein n=1 Tax=Microbacterium sp. TaxID=51671 RepID=UPI003C7936D7
MSTRSRSTLGVVVIGSAIFALAACGQPLGRSGATVDPVTISSTWGNGPGGIGSDVLDAIVASDAAPAIVVTAPSEDGRAPVDDYEGATITLLQEGAVDFSVVRADRLVQAGASSLAPLQAPLVVKGPEHATAIAADPVSEDLMSGLDEIGLVGVALVPGGTRRIFGYRDPVLGPEDYAGAVFNTRTGTGVDDLFAALGATTEHSTGDERTKRAASGASRGIEVSLQQAGAADLPAVMTTNIDLYTKFDVVVVRKEVWEGLTSAQQSALYEKVQDGATTAQDERPTDAEALAGWCASPGAGTATATDAQVAGVHAALQTVVDRISKDPDAKAAIARISALAPAEEPAALSGCDGVSESPTEHSITPSGDQTVLDGTWRLEITLEPLLAAGMSRSEALANVGVWTWRVENGRAVVNQPHGSDCTVQFVFADDEFSMDWGAEGNQACYGAGRGTYRLNGNRAYLDFTAERDYDPSWDDALFAGGLVRIE